MVQTAVQNLHQQGVATIAKAVRSGKTCAAQVVDCAITDIQTRDPELHAFVETTMDNARTTAADVDAARESHASEMPLAGVPFACTDDINLIQTGCTCCSLMLRNYRSMFTATAAERLQQAGAVSVGKLNMDEFGCGGTTASSIFGPTSHPFDADRIPGGAAGGAACAVAAGLVPLALAVDAAGSVRYPAALCGACALKPTYGLISRQGVVGCSSSLAQVSPVARTIADLACAMDVLTGHDDHDCTSQTVSMSFAEALTGDLSGYTIGLAVNMLHQPGVSAEMVRLVEESAQRLQDAGASIVEVELPLLDEARAAYHAILACEAFSNLARFDGVRYGYRAENPQDLTDMMSRTRAEGFGPEIRHQIALGAYLLSSGVYEQFFYPAQQVRTLVTRRLAQLFNDVSAVLMPAAPSCAPRFDETCDADAERMREICGVHASLAGNPAVTVCAGKGSDSGLLTGVQLLGTFDDDARLLHIASFVQNDASACVPATCSACEGGDR